MKALPHNVITRLFLLLRNNTEDRIPQECLGINFGGVSYMPSSLLLSGLETRPT